MCRRMLLSTAIVLCFSFLSLQAYAQFDGSSRLDIVAFPIPCTVIDILKQEGPCERTLLKFDIESLISLSYTVSGLKFSLNSSVGIAGPEHLILGGVGTIGSTTLSFETWLAAPYESDVDSIPMLNVVLIAPGDVLFVTTRVMTELVFGGVNIRNLAMIADVTFPNPSADYPCSL